MKHKAVKVGLTALVLAAAFGGLLFSTLGEATEYYKLVNEVMVQPEPWYGKKLQLHGYAKQVSRKPNSLEYRFQVENNGHTVTATYTGVVPDTFKNDAEVVLKGHADAGGLQRRAERRDGEVPVEVRTRQAATGANRRLSRRRTLALNGRGESRESASAFQSAATARGRSPHPWQHSAD